MEEPYPHTLEDWSRLLLTRKERLQKLVDIHAPQVMVKQEQELVAEAEAAIQRLLREMS